MRAVLEKKDKSFNKTFLVRHLNQFIILYHEVKENLKWLSWFGVCTYKLICGGVVDQSSPGDFYPQVNQASLADPSPYLHVQIRLLALIWPIYICVDLRHLAKFWQILSAKRSGTLGYFQWSWLWSLWEDDYSAVCRIYGKTIKFCILQNVLPYIEIVKCRMNSEC